MQIVKEFTLSRRKLLNFLDELKTASIIMSTYLPIETALSETEELYRKATGEQDVEQLAKMATGSKTGSVLFATSSSGYLILPPFPVKGKVITRESLPEPLSEQLGHDSKIALVLVRLGAYAVGLCQGENLINSKVGTGLIHSRHKQGGSSQQRFRRHREKQIEYFMTRVCGHIHEKLEQHVRTVDWIVYGGAHTTILTLQKSCSLLEKFNDRVLPPLLDIPDPRQRILEWAVARVWSSKVIAWKCDGS